MSLSGCGLQYVLDEFSGRRDSEFGFIDRTGTLVIPKSFTEVSRFSEGLAAAAIDESGHKWGFIDRAGKYAISPKYADTLDFHEGKAAIQVIDDPDAPGSMYGYGGDLGSFVNGRSWGYIDKSGKVIIPPRLEAVGSFHFDLAPARKGNKWGYIDTTGRFVIQPQFESATNFGADLAVVSLGGKHGYINRVGELVISPRFEDAYPFIDGSAVVRSGGKFGVIDRAGKFVLEPKYSRMKSLSEGLVGVESNMAELSPSYDTAAERFVVAAGGGCILYNPCNYDKNIPKIVGFIDRTGKLVVRLDPHGSSFVRLGRFKDGLAQFAAGFLVQTGYVDKSGSTVIPMQFQTAHDFSEGLAAVGYQPPPSF